MSQQNPTINYASNPLQPAFGKAEELAVNLIPNTTFVKGTVLGQVTGSANDVQTLTITGAPTGGTFSITGVNPVTGSSFTVTSAYNVSTATLQTSLQAASVYGANNVTVTGTAGSSYVLTFGGGLANMPVQLVTVANAFTGGTSPAIAAAHTTTGQTANTYKAYASGNSDGSQTAKVLLKFSCITDANGDISLNLLNSSGGQWGQKQPAVQAYINGRFRTEDLTGLDANAVSELGRLVMGTVSSGLLSMF